MNCSNYFSSVTGRAALQRFDFPIVNELLAVHILQSFGFDRIGAPLPAEARDLVRRTDGGGGIAMAVEAESHAEGFVVAHFVHLVNAPVTFHATESARDVDGVVEINVVRRLVNLHRSEEHTSELQSPC